jgi:predicted nucleic acid-binding protein
MTAERLVVDTWGWLSLADDREPRHRQVRDVMAKLGRAGETAITTDYILDETFTLVFRRLPFARARRFMATLDQAERDGSLRVELVGGGRFAAAKALRVRFRDKPDISFTDLTTMAVMHELRLIRILTADEHFHHVGLGFQLLP